MAAGFGARTGQLAVAGSTGEENHFERLARLLEAEREVEARSAQQRSIRLSPAEAEASGTALVDLVIAEVESGLGGRYLLRLVKRQRTALPWTRLDVGSPVVVWPQNVGGKIDDLAMRGVVCERRRESLSVAVSSFPDTVEDFERWRVDLSSDEISSDRQRQALERAAHASGEPPGYIARCAVGRARASV